ncbi:MAG: sensor histidine kinase [Erysipelotrichaceae bacterium]
MPVISRHYADWGIDLMDKFTLKWKVFTYFIGFCALLLAVLWVFQTILLPDMYQWIRTQEIHKAISLVELHLETDDLGTIINELAETKDIMVTPTLDFIPPNKPYQSGGRRVMESITETKDFTLSNGSNVSLTFYAIISPVDATLSTLQYQLYLITFFMIVIALGYSLVLSRRIAKPIETLNTQAKLLAQGKYGTPFVTSGYLEVNELSDTLHTTSVELGKVEALRKELMANVSHDMRTPLALISGYAQLMSDFPEEITQAQVQVILEESNRLSQLVADVLTLSSMEQKQVKAYQDINLHQVIQQTISKIKTLTPQSGFVFSYPFQEDIYVQGNFDALVQVVYNLLTNAMQYSGDSKEILVQLGRSQGNVIVEVHDHGAGIASEELPYVWERYYRCTLSHERAIVGTGLGLSIVKQIITQHGGTYGVRSIVGEGSCFWFALPLIKQTTIE